MIFRTPTRLGDVLSQCPGGDNNGFDHNFVLTNTEGKLNFVCRVEHPPSGFWLLFLFFASGDQGVTISAQLFVCPNQELEIFIFLAHVFLRSLL